MKIKFTDCDWHVVDFAGHQFIKTEPYYDAGIDVFDLDECAEAEANAKLAAASRYLLKACIKQKALMDEAGLIDEDLNLAIEKAL